MFLMQAAREEWRTIAGYEGMYEVSDLGRVRSLDRVDCAGRKRKGVILKTNNDVYLGVNLTKDGKSHFVRVANLVAEAFLGERPFGYEIHHKDADTHNNRSGNLEYVTPKKNKDHSSKTGKGRFSIADVEAIFGAYRDGATVAEIANQHGVKSGTIAGILTGRRYKIFLSDYPTLAPIELRGVKKISDDAASEIRKRYGVDGQSCYTLGREYGVHPTTIHKIVTGARRADKKITDAVDLPLV